MTYTVIIFDRTRERVKERTFEFRHEAMSWLVLSGFVTEDMRNPYTGDYAEIQKETKQ